MWYSVLLYLKVLFLQERGCVCYQCSVDICVRQLTKESLVPDPVERLMYVQQNGVLVLFHSGAPPGEESSGSLSVSTGRRTSFGLFLKSRTSNGTNSITTMQLRLRECFYQCVFKGPISNLVGALGSSLLQLSVTSFSSLTFIRLRDSLRPLMLLRSLTWLNVGHSIQMHFNWSQTQRLRDLFPKQLLQLDSFQPLGSFTLHWPLSRGAERWYYFPQERDHLPILPPPARGGCVCMYIKFETVWIAHLLLFNSLYYKG